MERKNKSVELPAPTPPFWSENPNTVASRTYFMSSSALPPLPTTSFEPHFMNHVVAAGGASSSGTKTGLRPPTPLFTNINSATDHNPFSESTRYTSGTTVFGNGAQIQCGQKFDPDMDSRKLKRILSNRLSAQKSRMKRLQHVADMEKKAEALEAQIAILRPQVEKFRAQKQFLELEQKCLNQQIAACASRKQHLDAQIELNRAEVNKLGQQKQKLLAQAQADSVWQSVSPEQYGSPQAMYFNPNRADVGDTTEEIMRLKQLSLNQQQLGNSGKMIPTPGWEPEQESLTNMGFRFNQSDPAPSFNFNRSERGPSFSFNQSESGPSFIQPITHRLGYEGMNPSVLGELEQMLNIDALNQDPCLQ